MDKCEKNVYNTIHDVVKDVFKSRNLNFWTVGFGLWAEFEVDANPNESKEEFVTRFFHAVWKAVGSMILFPIDVKVLSERYEPDGEDFVNFIQAKREGV